MALFKLCLKMEIVFQLFFPCSRGVCYCLLEGKSFLRVGSTSYKAQHNAFVEICTPWNILWCKPWAVLKPAPDLAPLPLWRECVLALPTSLGLHQVNLLWRKMALGKSEHAVPIMGISFRYWRKNCYPGQAVKLDPFQVIYSVFYSVHQPYIWNV